MSNVIQLFGSTPKTQSTDQLKRLWDSWSGDPCELAGGYEGEEIWLELNRRGEGEYCAV